jgi:hypothetical protein
MTNTPPPPEATPPPPPPPPGAAPAPAGTGIAIGPAQILGIVGAVLVLIPTWLNWISVDLEGFEIDYSAYQIPAYILRDNTVDIPSGGLNLGVLTLLVAVVCIVGALVTAVRWLLLVGGILAVGIAADFLWQMNEITDDFENSLGVEVGLFDIAGFAPLIALVGGIVAIVGGAMSLRRA